MTQLKEELQVIGEDIYRPNDHGVDKRNEIYNKIISYAGRVDSSKKATEMLKVAVELQRKVLRIKDDTDTDAIAKAAAVGAGAAMSAADAYKMMLNK